MNEHQQADRYTSRLLLLGTGNTGKTTFFRQFRFMAGKDFTRTEREALRPPIENQVVFFMMVLAQEAKRRFELETDDPDRIEFLSEEILKKIDRLNVIQPSDRATTLCSLDQETYLLVKELWEVDELKRLFADENDEMMRHLSIPETCRVFWDDIDRIGDLSYVPADDDLILLRSTTTGSQNFEYTQHHQKFCIIDVGGQRSERKKWMKVFDESITAVLYVVSLSAYDEYLFEDSKVNSMEDQIQTFEETINQQVFSNVPVILFLNKKDLLEKKLSVGRPISRFFKDFDGDDSSVSQSMKYIRNVFVSKNGNPSRQIFVHETFALDTRNVRRVLHDVTKSLVRKALAETHLLPMDGE